MRDFVQTLLSPDVTFLRYALFTVLLASVAFGVVGSYVVVRRISYIAAAIAHSVLGGIGLSVYLQGLYAGATGAPAPFWLDPMLFAAGSALLAALLVGAASRWARQREDSVIGAIWAGGMALGLVFFNKAQGAGFVDPMSYLFGDILMISRTDLWLVAALDVVVAATAVLLQNRLLAVCFDEEFARLRGVRATGYYFLLLVLAALTVVLLVRVVGIVLVIAMLTLPAAAAAPFSRRLWQMTVLAAALCACVSTLGLGAAFLWDLPAGPVIILVAAGAYLLLVGGHALFKRGAKRRGGTAQ